MTPMQQRAMEAIRRLTIDGVSPSYEDIQAECGLSSKSHVHRLVHALKERGLVDFKPGRHRSIVVLGNETPAIDRISEAVAARFAVPLEAARAAVLAGWMQ